MRRFFITLFQVVSISILLSCSTDEENSSTYFLKFTDSEGKNHQFGLAEDFAQAGEPDKLLEISVDWLDNTVISSYQGARNNRYSNVLIEFCLPVVRTRLETYKGKELIINDYMDYSTYLDNAYLSLEEADGTKLSSKKNYQSNDSRFTIDDITFVKEDLTYDIMAISGSFYLKMTDRNGEGGYFVKGNFRLPFSARRQ